MSLTTAQLMASLLTVDGRSTEGGVVEIPPGARLLLDVIVEGSTPGDLIEGLSLLTPEVLDDIQAAAALGPTNDSATASFVNNLSSSTRAALAAVFTTETATGGSVWKVGPTEVNVRSYGVSDTNSAAQNDAAMAALFADHTASVQITFPDRGTFNFSAPFAYRPHMVVRGRGRQTILNWIAGNAFKADGSTLAQTLKFYDLNITNSGTALHLFDISGTGGLIHTTFERCFIQPGVNGASILKAQAYNLFGLTFRDCLLHRLATATVPAFDIVGISGGGTNNIHFSGGEWHSHGCSSSPFFKADANSASTMLNFTFEKIIGEQNLGGLIHLGGAGFVRVFDVVDQDAPSAYVDDLFKFTAGTGGVECNVVNIDRAGSYTSFGLTAGKAHLRITGGIGHKVGRISKDTILPGTIVVPARGVTVQGNSAAEVPPFEAIGTLPATLASSSHTVLVSVTGTLTLPATAPLVVGQEVRVKVVAAGGCTVAGNAANIDATSTITLAQYEAATLIWDGIRWRRY